MTSNFCLWLIKLKLAIVSTLTEANKMAGQRTKFIHFLEPIRYLSLQG